MIYSLSIRYREKSDLERLPVRILAHPCDRMLIQVFSGVLEEKPILALIDALKTAFPGASILGTTTAGEILDGHAFDKSIVVNFTCFSETAIRTALVCQNDNLTAAGDELADALQQPGIKAIIAFGCGIKEKRLPCSQGLLNALHARFPDTVIAGGQAGDNGKCLRTQVFTAEGITDSGFAAVSLAGDSLVAHNDYTLSWVPIGKKLTITRVEGSRVYAIDGQTPYEIYRHYLGDEIVDDLPMSAVDFPLMIERDGILMAVHAIGVNADGSFDYIHDFHPGEQFRFGYCHTGLIADGAG